MLVRLLRLTFHIMLKYDTEKAANLIRQWESQSGLKGKDVCRISGVKHSYYSEIRNGNKRGSIDTLKKIVAVFGKSLDDLTGENKNPPSLDSGADKDISLEQRMFLNSIFKDRELYSALLDLRQLTKELSPEVRGRLASVLSRLLRLQPDPASTESTPHR